METEIWKIRLIKKYGDEVLPQEFDSKEKAETFFEAESMDYDYYNIYKVK